MYFHKAMEYLVARIQVPVTAVDDKVLWCVREDTMRCTTVCFKREEGPFLTLLLPLDHYCFTLDIQEIFDGVVYLEIKRHKIFDLTQEGNHTMDRSYTNFHYVYESYNSH